MKYLVPKLLFSFSASLSLIRVKLVRVGHPARLLPQVLDSALDAQVYTCSDVHEKKYLDMKIWVMELLHLIWFAVHSDSLFWSINATMAFFFRSLTVFFY